jgi:RTX calcium-binding nonapeptide repeat (4 copies)
VIAPVGNLRDMSPSLSLGWVDSGVVRVVMTDLTIAIGGPVPEHRSDRGFDPVTRAPLIWSRHAAVRATGDVVHSRGRREGIGMRRLALGAVLTALATGVMVAAALAPSGASVTCGGQAVTVDLGLGQTPTTGDDVIWGTPETDIIDGLAGHDIICGRGSRDIVNAGIGSDMVFAGAGNDDVNGGRGNDQLRGGFGHDVLRGQRGSDQIFGGPGTDVANGGAGIDNCFAEIFRECEGD